MVVLRGVPFHSLCEHHLLPFEGAGSHCLSAGWEGGRDIQARSGGRHVCPTGRRSRSG